jgi:hypothetical protein
MADELINPLAKLVQARLPWLFSEYGFKIVDYSSDRLGNWAAVLESEQLRLAFSQDRNFSQVQLASRSDPAKSYELGFLLLALQDSRPDVGFEGNAALLKDNWQLLVNALGPKLAETRQEYERRELVSKEIFERWQGRINTSLTPRGRIRMWRKTAPGRVLFLLLRYIEVGLILWAIYIVFNHRST